MNTATATDFSFDLLGMLIDAGFDPCDGFDDGVTTLPSWMAGRYEVAAITATGFVAVNVDDAEAQSLTIVAMDRNGVIDDEVHVCGGRAVAIAEAVIGSFW